MTSMSLVGSIPSHEGPSTSHEGLRLESTTLCPKNDPRHYQL